MVMLVGLAVVIAVLVQVMHRLLGGMDLRMSTAVGAGTEGRARRVAARTGLALRSRG